MGIHGNRVPTRHSGGESDRRKQRPVASTATDRTIVYSQARRCSQAEANWDGFNSGLSAK